MPEAVQVNTVRVMEEQIVLTRQLDAHLGHLVVVLTLQ
jgi:hypothetical protein